ncbi:hypothetical protein PACTADRAFT_15773 [Pachysolen tannophilus NRRL Y-2460]|uniref:Uncharacterized protein n=1 Tax=Pachysolen tannophilus NRRL Y-2460 TaxID=669874 RepID=A0A1E4TZU3_PACTA|nr:hypothetical protein PACTADRAFT_15773 [Pachysolen tannophilus NRRL Y-2460]
MKNFCQGQFSIIRILTILLILCSSVCAYTSKDLDKIISKSKNNIIKITDKNYNKILNNERKDYHIAVYLTASSPRVGCALCNEFQPIYTILANSFAENLKKLNEQERLELNKNGGDKIFFAIADFSDNMEFFTKLSLNNVPKLFYFHPTNSNLKDNNDNLHNNFDEYAFTTGDQTTALANWLISNTPIKIPPKLFQIIQPLDYSKIITRLIIIISIIIIIYKFSTKFNKIVYSKAIYQSISIITIILFTCGYMFNQIRMTPYTKTNNDGSFTYFVSGHQAQLGVETQIISGIYAILFVSISFLLNKVNQIKNLKIKFLTVVIMVFTIFISYAVLVNIYHLKHGAYPFYILKFF